MYFTAFANGKYCILVDRTILIQLAYLVNV